MMMLPTLFYMLSAVLAMSSEVMAQTTARATATLVGHIQGTLVFEQIAERLLISGNLLNVPFGLHGIHVHEYGNTGNQCYDSGGHYNPTNNSHGAPTDTDRHIGDFGNIDVFSSPTFISINDHVAKLDGPYSILDRSIVIHAGVDDLGRGNSPSSKINGNSGPRIGCGVIQEV